MAYTPKELTEKYENLWEQVDGLYKEMSALTEYVSENETKYDSIWAKVSEINDVTKGIDSKYDLIWGKCNTNTEDIIRLKEHIINSGDPQLASIKYDLSVLQGKFRSFDKMEQEYKTKMSHIQCDMFDIQRELKKTNEYIDDKFTCHTIIIQIIICVMVLMCLYIIYIVK